MMKILFIAYYFEPYSGVGAKRISYWAKHLRRIEGNVTKCDVITAVPQNQKFDNIDNVFYLANTNQGLLRKFIKFDKGASWIFDLKKYVKRNIQKNGYDFVVLTGDPFLHFFIVDDFKKLGIKTIIDFRDPFANNPRGIAKNTLIKKAKHFVLRKIENYFLSKANYIISVNQYCVELFENYTKYLHKIKIIDNGYNEQIFKNINVQSHCKSEKNIIKLSYAGKLYKDRNPQVFLKCLRSFSDINFYHIGEQSEYIESDTKQIKSLGFMSYENTLQLLTTFDVCMIFTSGYSFESTTKIFDYIALNKIIFIVTDGEVKTGQIYQITKGYPAVYWANNNSNDIERVLKNIEKDINKDIFFNSYKYSREYGLKQLVEILHDK